jgi:hypothetical protein
MKRATVSNKLANLFVFRVYLLDENMTISNSLLIVIQVSIAKLFRRPIAKPQVETNIFPHKLQAINLKFLPQKIDENFLTPISTISKSHKAIRSPTPISAVT